MQLFEKSRSTVHGVGGARRVKNFERVLGTEKFRVQNGLYTLFTKSGDKGDRLFRENQAVVTALDHEERWSIRIHPRDG
jgi:hypothetical protein